MEIWIDERKPEVLDATNILLAVLLHVAFFAVCFFVARLSFAPKESVIPIDMTVVVNENLDGNDEDPPPLDDPPEEPKVETPKVVTPPKVETPPPPPVVDRRVEAVEQVRETKKEEPKKTKKELEEERIRRIRDMAKVKTPPKKEEPKKTKKELEAERLKRMRDSASVKRVDIKVPNQPSGNGRTERQTMTRDQILKALADGARAGKTTQLAKSEEQRCVSLIQREYEAKWDQVGRPAWTSSLKTAYLTVKFGPGGRVLGWSVSQSSGDASADQSVRRAAAMVTQVAGLSAEFIAANKAGVTVRFKVRPN